MTDVGNVNVKLGLNSKEFINNLDKAKNELKNFGGGLSQGANSINMLQGALGKLAAGGALALISKQILDFSAKSVEAFRVQDRAIKSLNTALANSGVYTSGYAKHLRDLSSEIQSFSNYGDEAIEKAIGLGQAFSGNIKLTDKLIKATVDYAAATETDLQTAFTLVGKSIGTSTNALARYGVNLDQSMSKEEKMAVITETLAQRFSGSAQDMADKSVQLKNAVGDLSEEIGGVLNPAVEACQSVLIKFVTWLKESIKSIKDFLASASMATSEANRQMAAGMKKEAQYYTNLAAEEMKRAEELRRKGQTTRANAVQRRAEDYLKHAKEYDEASSRRLAHAEELQKKEENIAKRNNKPISNNISTRTSSTAKESLKQEVDEYKKLNDMIANYRENIASTEISNQVGKGNAFLAGLSSQYKAKLDLEVWYQDERRKIIEESNGNLQLQQEAFGQLDLYRNAKIAESNLLNWEDYGNALASVMSATYTNLITGQENFGDAMKNLARNMLIQLLQMLMQYVVKEMAIRAASMFLGAFGGGGAPTGVTPSIVSHHSGGMISGTKEQLAVLQGGERVLNRSEAANYNSGQETGSGEINNVMVFNIKAWDGKDVISTLKANSQTINQIVSSGIKSNNQGLRTVVQNI